MSPNLPPFRRQLLPILTLVLVVVSIGTAGYMAIEGWSFLDSLYMTAITLTTVGFGEVSPLSQSGRLFTMVLMILGVGTIIYALTASAEYLLAADLGPRLRDRRWRRILKEMQDHVIVCGYGRVGRSAAVALREFNEDLVIIEDDRSNAEIAQSEGFLVVRGDATKDEALSRAGAGRAAGLITCLGSDADNLFIILSAKAINPRLKVVSRNVDLDNEGKLIRAGADRVISPYMLGGRYMANILTRPRVTEFLGSVTLDSGLELWLEEMSIAPGSELAGLTVGQSDIRNRTGSSLVGLVRQSSGDMISPDKSTLLQSGDVLIVLGTRQQLAQLAAMVDSRQAE